MNHENKTKKPVVVANFWNVKLTMIMIIIALLVVIISFVYLLVVGFDTDFRDNFTKYYCSNESINNNSNGTFCSQQYDPVCGWSNPEKIQCIKYPCAETFSNSCFACSGDNDVLYYTYGECPEGVGI